MGKGSNSWYRFHHHVSLKLAGAAMCAICTNMERFQQVSRGCALGVLFSEQIDSIFVK